MVHSFISSVLLLLILLDGSFAEASKARLQALQLSSRGFVASGPKASAPSQRFLEVPQNKPNLPLAQLKMPVGFEITIFAVVPHPRALSLGENGQVFVGSRDDKVYRVTDRDLNGQADKVEILFSGLDQPNGVAYREGHLYVGEKTGILKIENANAERPQDIRATGLAEKFPEAAQKNWKFIRFGADDWLYVNLATPEGASFHKLNVKNEKGAFAGSTPPTVGFDWDSQAQKLWVPSLQMQLPPYIIPLGVRFDRSGFFSSGSNDQVFLVEQGSWKGSELSGYRISQVTVKNGKAVRYRPFIEGWSGNGKPWGQPIDIEFLTDGSMLISDDQAGVIYRLNYLLR